MNKNTRQARAAGYITYKAFLEKDETKKVVKGRCVKSYFGSPENKRNSPVRFREEGMLKNQKKQND